jgi:glutathione peroxidase
MIRSAAFRGLAPLVLAGLVLAVPAAAEPGAAAPDSPLGFTMTRIDGAPQPLSDYAGDVLLLVNVASRCGHTPQYEGLERLHERYRARGFAVLGFPANDFGGQEPGTDAEIAEFCRSTYGVSFPMFSKISVKEPGAHPLYRMLTALPEPVGGPVAWNFQKYLVDREGRVVARFEPATKPEDTALVAVLERLLDAPRP